MNLLKMFHQDDWFELRWFGIVIRILNKVKPDWTEASFKRGGKHGEGSFEIK